MDLRLRNLEPLDARAVSATVRYGKPSKLFVLLLALLALAGVTACGSHAPLQASPPSAPALLPPPQPLPNDTCGPSPDPASSTPAAAVGRTTVEMPAATACRHAPSSGGGSGSIRGIASVVAVPWGLVSLGGAELCVLRQGESRWEHLFEVQGDNLYRVAGDGSGKLLATWEKDPDIHLFDREKKQHVRIRKPAAPSAQIFEYGASDLYFSDHGRTAVVFMENRPPSPPTTHGAYLFDLENAVAPRPLFVQTGLLLRASSSAAVFAVPRYPERACFDLGCWPIAEIRAWQVSGGVARCKTLLSGAGDWLERARALPGSDEDAEVAVLIAAHSRSRGLLRWRYEDARADYRPMPPPSGPDWAANASRLTRAGDLVEVWDTEAWGLRIQRHSPAGAAQSIVLPPLPRRGGLTDTEGAHVVKERANGELFVHWGDYLLLLSAKGVRLMNLEPVPGGREWAWVDIYVPEPEALWMGVERGGGRDFEEVPFARIEHAAKEWPAVRAEIQTSVP